MAALEICCRGCKSSLPGTCHKSGDCRCHLEQKAIARKQDNKPSRPPHPDPVGEQGTGNAYREQKRRRRKERSG